MNRLLRSPLVLRAVSSLCLLLLVFTQIIPLRAETWPTQWSFERLENSSSEWWHSLRVQTVPGVLYHLQQSETLADGSWTTVETTYGSGEEWICPLMQGDAPPTPSSGQPVVPPVPANPIRLAYLIIEKTDTGDTLASWWSLDDHTPKRMILSGVTLDPVWDEFDAPYFNQHGNFYFALSPNMHRTVNFTAPAPSLGTLDTAMIAEFTSSLATITSNITQSVANAALFSHQPQPTGARKFYRIAADWSLDSDGDGRLDWQELVIDGNNPFAADSDGDGNNDVAAAGTGSGGGPTTGYPVPTDAVGPTPLASIQQQLISVVRHAQKPTDEEQPLDIRVEEGWDYPATLTEAQRDDLEGATSFASFIGVMENLPIDPAFWYDGPLMNHSQTYIHTDNPAQGLEWSDHFECTRAVYRLKLDQPAPVGGYEIKLRIGIIRQTVSLDPYQVSVDQHSEGESTWKELTLTCPEGATEGPPVVFSYGEALGNSKRVTFVPVCVAVRGPDVADFIMGPIPEDGTCVMNNEEFVLDAGNPHPDTLFDYDGPPLELRWMTRKLEGDRKLATDWEAIFELDPENPLELRAIEGAHKSVAGMNCGIYQVKAVLILPDATMIDFPFVRMRDSRSIKNRDGDPNPLLKAGQPDYIGICKDATSMAVRVRAVTWLGATGYSLRANVPILPGDPDNPVTRDASKCNIFVTHIANQEGATTPYFRRIGRTGAKPWQVSLNVPAAPMAKEDWNQEPEDNVDLDAPGWFFLFNAANPPVTSSVADFSDPLHPMHSWVGGPCPGMTCSSPRTSAGSKHGHVGIMDYDGSWINAGEKTVNKSIHLLDTLQDYKPNAFRSR